MIGGYAIAQVGAHVHTHVGGLSRVSRRVQEIAGQTAAGDGAIAVVAAFVITAAARGEIAFPARGGGPLRRFFPATAPAAAAAASASPPPALARGLAAVVVTSRAGRSLDIGPLARAALIAIVTVRAVIAPVVTAVITALRAGSRFVRAGSRFIRAGSRLVLACHRKVGLRGRAAGAEGKLILLAFRPPNGRFG